MYNKVMKKENHVKKGYRLFLNLCCQQKTTAAMQALLDFFLTPEEKDAMARRVTLTQALLKDKLTQREIASTLKVSIAKITRGSNMLKLTNDKTKAILIKGLLDKINLKD
jgi:TrpR family trp operon transcriptional repressor